MGTYWEIIERVLLTMDVKMKLIVFAIDLILPLAIGYACRYQHVIKEQVFNKMILNNILVVCPVVSFLSFWVLPVTMDLLWLPVISIFMGLVPGVIAYYIAERKYTSDIDRGSYVMSAILSNLGTIGGICVFLIYGEKGYGYQQIILLFQYILMFMFCYPLAQFYYQRANGGSKIKRISVMSVLFSKNQIAVVGIALGGLLQYAGVARPEGLDGLAMGLIHLGAWTGLLPVGYSMDFSKIKLYYKELTDLSIIKFIVTPLVIYVVSHFLCNNQEMLNTLLILSCTPVAVNAVVVSRIYHLNVNIGVAAFIVTTVLFLFIQYPLLFFILAK